LLLDVGLWLNATVLLNVSGPSRGLLLHINLWLMVAIVLDIWILLNRNWVRGIQLAASFAPLAERDGVKETHFYMYYIVR